MRFGIGDEVGQQVAIGILVFVVGAGVEAWLGNRRWAKYIWLSVRNWNQNVRVSISVLYRIEIEGEYLLVPSARFPGRFQPVGGVLKAYGSGVSELRRLGVRDDDVVPIDSVSDGDLRVRVPGRNLVGFLRWYDSGLGRELSGWREFQEELVSTGILQQATFTSIREDALRRHESPARYSEWAGSHEIFIAEIRIVLPTEAQALALRRLKLESSEGYVWVSASTIERRGIGTGATEQIQIAEQTSWIL